MDVLVAMRILSLYNIYNPSYIKGKFLIGEYKMKMPKDDIDTTMFAPCGMNCFVCYKHCYHKKPCEGCLNSDQGKLDQN